MNLGSVSLLRTLSRDTTGCKAAAGNGAGQAAGKGERRQLGNAGMPCFPGKWGVAWACRSFCGQE